MGIVGEIETLHATRRRIVLPPDPVTDDVGDP
jgi:hypothetical protein